MKLHHMYSPGFGFLIWYGREYIGRPICWEIQIWKWKVTHHPRSDEILITKGRKMKDFAAGLWVFLCGFVFGYYVAAPLIWKLKDFLEKIK